MNKICDHFEALRKINEILLYLYFFLNGIGMKTYTELQD